MKISNSLLLILGSVILLSITSCNNIPDITPISIHQECDDKPILSFDNISDLQIEYNQLKADVDTATDNQPLIDFETTKSFYSLRNKDEDMDDGVIPDDPTFDSWDYTSDDILQSILNEDGMVIIDNELYMWNDGCVGFKTQFDCNNYDGLIILITEFLAGNMSNDRYYSILSTYDISVIDICEEIFDFESNYENYKVENNTGVRAECTLDAVVDVKIISNNPITKIAEIELTAYNLTSSSYVANTWYLDSIGSEVTIIGGSLPGPVNQLWNQAGGFYVGKFLRIRVDYNTINFLDVNLVSIADDLECSPDIDRLTIDLVCPILLSAEPLNLDIGQWKYTITGLDAGAVGLWQWDFGDGTIITSSNRSEIHTFGVPCAGSISRGVSVSDLEGTMPCNFPLSKQTTITNPCMVASFRDHGKTTIGGKKVKYVHKIKGNGKIKSKLKHRVAGKSITAVSGDVLFEQGNNCITVSLAQLMGSQGQSWRGHDGNPASHNKKRRLKQRYKDGRRFYCDLNNPYSINFTTNDGYNFTYQKGSGCLQIK